MFAGIIEETGILLSVKGGSSGFRPVIGTDRILEDIKRGDNAAVNSVCLTAAPFGSGCFLVDMIPETLKRPNLDCLPIESSLSLGWAMIAGGRFGGHIMSDHIDGTGTVVNVVRDGNALWCTIHSVPSTLCRVIEKGSIATDGVNLMVAQVREQDFSVPLIPHTASHTTLGALKLGRVVNLENSCVGKYIEGFMKISPSAYNTEGEDTRNRGTGSRITPGLLKQCGF